jgi:hypothetical protein
MGTRPFNCFLRMPPVAGTCLTVRGDKKVNEAGGKEEKLVFLLPCFVETRNTPSVSYLIITSKLKLLH